jgi:hypothetical protein
MADFLLPCLLGTGGTGPKGGIMIHRVLIGEQAGDMAKALYVEGEAFFPPLSLEPTFVNCFRIFSPLAVITADEQQDFDSMLQKKGLDYGDVEVRADVGAYLGFAGHPY